MPQKKAKSASTPRRSDPERGRRIRRAILRFGAACLAIGLLGAGVRQTRRYVEQVVAVPLDSFIIVIKDRPHWMSDDTVQQIVSSARPTGAHSAFDREMLVGVRQRLEHNPWVTQVVQVRRAYTNQPGDTLEINCTYRVPSALVHWGQYYWLVDRTGFKLPEQFPASGVPREVLGLDGRINLRIIDGVRHAPPEAGNQWPGDDIAAGLEMTNVLFDRPYTEEIVKIDVSNAGGRQDPRQPQITLFTKYGSSILWGRPPGAKDAFIETAPERKLELLKRVYETYGRVDGRQPWIDIRLDGVLKGAPPEPQEAQAPHTSPSRRPQHAQLDRER